MKEALRLFITENFLYGQKVQFSDDDSFIEHGLIDSTGILELVSFIEQEYGITVGEDDLVPDNLDSINRLTTFIARKQTTVPEIPEERGRALAG
ncbi:MAG: acyl carrier protein [Terriglobales bacterium]